MASEWQWFINLCYLGIGIILGRLTMAIQYAIMKPKQHEKSIIFKRSWENR